MFKKFMVALAGLFVMLGLAAAPAGASAAVDEVDLYALPGLLPPGTGQTFTVPGACTELPVSTGSADARASSVDVGFYSSSTCSPTSRVAIAPAGAIAPAIVGATHFRGTALVETE